jgi:hypothetical protein
LILSWKFSALATDQCVKKSACCQSELTNLSLREVHPIDIEVSADEIANPGYGFNRFQQRLKFCGGFIANTGALGRSDCHAFYELPQLCLQPAHVFAKGVLSLRIERQLAPVENADFSKSGFQQDAGLRRDSLAVHGLFAQKVSQFIDLQLCFGMPNALCLCPGKELNEVNVAYGTLRVSVSIPPRAVVRGNEDRKLHLIMDHLDESLNMILICGCQNIIQHQKSIARRIPFRQSDKDADSECIEVSFAVVRLRRHICLRLESA